VQLPPRRTLTLIKGLLKRWLIRAGSPVQGQITKIAGFVRIKGGASIGEVAGTKGTLLRGGMGSFSGKLEGGPVAEKGALTQGVNP